MRSLLRYLLILTALIAAAWKIIPERYEMDFPRNPGPEFDSQVRNLYTESLDTIQPDIAMLGDSTLADGVDPDLLSQLMDKKISKFDVPGSASAYWYLVVKNNIVVAEHPPKVLVILFRDTILTAPGYRVHGAYFDQLDEFAARHEPLLLERSYLKLMNPLERYSEQYFPLYAARGRIRKAVDGLIRYSLPRWIGCDRNCTDGSMYEVFEGSDLEQGQLQHAIATAEQYLYTARQLDFERQIDASYLPEIIRLTKDRGIQLILVRLKNETGQLDNVKKASVSDYMGKLSDYLQSQDVLLLDYGTDSRLKDEHFKDALHLNRDGEIVFTQILAEGLNSLLR